MRLLHIDTYEFREFHEASRPKYVIASHRWHEGSEITFQDVRDGRNKHKGGYEKIEGFARYTKKQFPSVEWLWIDTCCINKDSAAELSESINLMFDWYRDAEVCIAYLADVEVSGEMSHLRRSEWFTRGWTLQELIAPNLVIFVTNTWQVLGHKGASTQGRSGSFAGPNLDRDIAEVTGIPQRALYQFNASGGWTVEERLNWMKGRETTREEDIWYALYGIFGVSPGVNYGERYDNAKQRLLQAVNYQDTLATEKANRFQQIKNWLSPSDPWSNHKSARERHEPQTGAWLLNCDEYQSWKSSSIRHLWLYGKAGCGKTVLCSTAIEDIKTHCKHAVNAGYAVFYFSFSDNRKMRYEDALLSLVVQLCWKEPGHSMLQQIYDRSDRTIPGPDELEEILLSCAKSYNKVFLLLDALDECPENNDVRHAMLKWLTRIAQNGPNIKIFATSRELPDIRASIQSLKPDFVPATERSVNADIRKYVTTQLSGHHRLARLDQRTKTLIDETLFAKANGMFRWAYCQLQELKKLKSTRPKHIREALYSLPPTLDETYERILLGIEESLRLEALTLLRWIAYAKRPPRLDELVDAAVIDLRGDGSVDIDDRGGLDDTLEILSGLVTIVQQDDEEDEENEEYEENGEDEEDEDGEGDEEDEADALDEEENSALITNRQHISGKTRVRLAHFSVKEYLESERILKTSAREFYLESATEHMILTQSCVTYLIHHSSSNNKNNAREQDLKSFPLLWYAASSWFYHSALHQSTEVGAEMRFLCFEDALHDWVRLWSPDYKLPAVGLPEPESFGSSLYYAVLVELEQVVKKCLELGADVNAQGGRFDNALHAAAYRGNEKVVQILLDAGAAVNAQGGHLGNALQAAAFIGNEKVVQILLDAGADINAQGEFHGNALQVAAGTGDEKVVQILLHAGADINAQGGFYGNALQAACSLGLKENIALVQMLVSAGADINAQGGNHGTALQAAVSSENEKVVQMLLDAGADVNAQGGGYYGNALQTACSRYGQGNIALVQMLIDAGADVNAQGGEHGTALKAALARGHDNFARLLREHGALEPERESEEPEELEDLIPGRIGYSDSYSFSGHSAAES